MQPRIPIKQYYTYFILIPIILFAPVLFTGKALFWGLPSLQFIPWWKWASETLLSGHLPLWNSLSGMGAPLLANYQSALFYPPYWLLLVSYAIGGISGLAWSQALVVVFHIAWGGIGMASLIHRLKMGVFAQTISGLVFALSGFVVARGWFFSINSAVVWLPWILLFAYDLVYIWLGNKPGDEQLKSISRKQVGVIAKLGGAIGMQLLSGHAQLTWYTIMLTGLWVGFWAWQLDSDKKNKFPRYANLAKAWFLQGIATILGVCIASVQLFPTAEYLLQSQRSTDINFEAAMTNSFWPWRFLGFFAPNLFGSPVTGDFWGYSTFWEDAIYIGLLPILLVLGVIIRAIFARRSRSFDSKDVVRTNKRFSLILFLSILIVISFLLALGKNTPIFPWLYQHIPTFNMFKSPTRFSIWAIFALALLVGVGIENWRRPTGRSLYWTRLSIAGAFAVSLGAGLGWLLLRNIPDFHISFVRATALAGFWGVGAGILSILAPQVGASKNSVTHRWQNAVVVWIVLDLLVAGWGLNPGVELDFYTYTPPNVNRIRSTVGDGRLFMLAADEYELTYEQYFTFESFDSGKNWYDLRSTFLPNLNVLNNIPMANNYDPMVPGRYAHWMEAIADLDIQSRDDLLDLMAVAVIETDDPAEEFGVHFEPRNNIPRETWVPCAVVAEDGEAAFEMVIDGSVDLSAKVIIEGEYKSANPNCKTQNGSANISDEKPNQVDVQVEASDSGWLVLADVWYPGWKAEIDGEPAEIFRANYLFRAVEVPAGSHTVSFVYQPVWFYVGLSLSLITVLLLFFGVVYSGRKNGS